MLFQSEKFGCGIRKLTSAIEKNPLLVIFCKEKKLKEVKKIKADLGIDN